MNSPPTDVPGATILIVDDDPDIGQALGDLLVHEGYATQVVGTGAEAVTRASHHHYGAVVLDMGLPDCDGLSVLKTLQELDQKLPVIVLTAYTTVEKTIGALSLGAFAYLTKPYNRDELRATLRRAVGMKALAVRAKTVESALTASEERFRSVVESATDAIVLADQHGTIISWNNAAQRLFGYAQAEVLGKPLTLIIPPGYREQHERGLERMRAGGASRVVGRQVELRGLRKDGSEFPLELSLATWKTHDGAFYSGIIRDISERRRNEEALIRLRRQHELILTEAGEGIYGLDRSGKTTFVNPAAARILGYTVEELLGLPMHEVLHHSKPDGTPYPEQECPIYAAFRDGQVHRVADEVFWRKDGTSFPVEYVSTPVREGGVLDGAVVVFRDVTERKEVEAQLIERARLAAFAAEVGLALTRYERLELTLQACADALVRYLDAAFARIWTLNRETDTLELVASAGLYTNLDGSHSRIRVGQLKVGLIAQERKPHLTNSVVGDPRIHDQDWAKREGMVAFAGYPLVVEERAVGVMALFARKPLSTATLQAMESVANGIALSIERKRAEAELWESEERLRLALKAGHLGIWDWNVASGGVVWSERVESLFGLRAGSFAGTSGAFLDCLHPDDRGRVMQAIAASVESGADYAVEHRIVWPDGSIRWLACRGEVLRDQRGKPVRMLGTVRDITEGKRAEEALRVSQEQFRQLAEHIREVFWITDPEMTRMIYISPGYEDIWGRTRESRYQAPRSWLDAIHPADRDRVLEAALTKQASGEYAEEYRIVRPDGSIRWIWDRAFPIRDTGGRVSRIAGIAEDITERKQT